MALKWIEGYNRWDADYMFSTVSADFMYYVYPNSLGIKSRNKEEFKELVTSVIFPMFHEYRVSILVDRCH